MRMIALSAVLLVAGCNGASEAPPAPIPDLVVDGPELNTAAAPQDALGVNYGDVLLGIWDSPTENGGAQPLNTDIPKSMTVSGPLTSAQFLEELQSKVLAFHPHVVALYIGTEDVAQGVEAPGSVTQIVEAIQQSGAIAIIGTLLPDAAHEEAVLHWNASIRLVAASTGAQLADYYADMNGKAQFFGADGMPNGAGFNEMWNVVLCEAEDVDHLGIDGPGT